MKKLIATVLSLVLTASAFPVGAIASGTAHAITGVATIDGKPHANVMLRLRRVDTGMLLGSTASNTQGRFAFSVLASGMFIVESVAASGAILGTSSAILIKPDAVTPTEVTVRTTATVAAAVAGMQGQAAPAAASGGLSAAAIAVIAIGAGLAVTGIVMATNDSSPSQ